MAAALYALHQDVWFWREARPLVFGFLPIGLFYHATYTLAISLLMWLLVRTHWPGHLEGNGDRASRPHRRHLATTEDTGERRSNPVQNRSSLNQSHE
jgi:hypothetical protein